MITIIGFAVTLLLIAALVWVVNVGVHEIDQLPPDTVMASAAEVGQMVDGCSNAYCEGCVACLRAHALGVEARKERVARWTKTIPCDKTTAEAVNATDLAMGNALHSLSAANYQARRELECADHDMIRVGRATDQCTKCGKFVPMPYLDRQSPWT